MLLIALTVMTALEPRNPVHDVVASPACVVLFQKTRGPGKLDAADEGPACAAAERATHGGTVTSLRYAVMQGHRKTTVNRDVIHFQATVPDAPLGRVGIRGELGRGSLAEWHTGEVTRTLDGADLKDVDVETAVGLLETVAHLQTPEVVALFQQGFKPGRLESAATNKNAEPGALYVVSFFKGGKAWMEIHTVHMTQTEVLKVKRNTLQF